MYVVKEQSFCITETISVIKRLEYFMRLVNREVVSSKEMGTFDKFSKYSTTNLVSRFSSVGRASDL